jgi:hypothetical protein
MFILDMTTQRKTISITGDAANDITWYETEVGGEMVKGWKFEAIRQGEALFSGENEFEKIFGISSMKNSDGTRRAVSPIIDLESDGVITAGDGLEEQIAGGNEIYGSGVNGEPTEDDFTDVIKLLVKKSNSADSKVNLIFLTGTDGFWNFQDKAPRILTALNGAVRQMVDGGADKVVLGYTTTTIAFGGSTLTVMIHPMFDDAKKFPAVSTYDGKNIMSCTYIGGNLEGDRGSQNMEIIPKGAHGGNRSMVTADLKGMTGVGSGTIITQKDADSYAILKEDMLAVYNTQNWAILRKS